MLIKKKNVSNFPIIKKWGKTPSSLTCLTSNNPAWLNENNNQYLGGNLLGPVLWGSTYWSYLQSGQCTFIYSPTQDQQ